MVALDWHQCQYLFDKKYGNKFLVYTLDEFFAEPVATQPLLYIAGKADSTLPIIDCDEPLMPLQDFLIKKNLIEIL